MYETLLSPINDILACYDFFIACLHLQQAVSFWVILLFLASLPIDLAKLIANPPESLVFNDICFSSEIVAHVWWIHLEWWKGRKGEKKISGINLFGGIVEIGTRQKSGTLFFMSKHFQVHANSCSLSCFSVLNNRNLKIFSQNLLFELKG